MRKMNCYVDLDETLVSYLSDEKLGRHVPLLHSVYARPHGERFLRFLHEQTNELSVVCWTSRVFAQRVLDQLGLSRWITKLYAFEDLSAVITRYLGFQLSSRDNKHHVSSFLLLDDFDLRSPMTQLKMQFVCELENVSFTEHHAQRCFLPVRPFYGDLNDDELLQLEREVENRLSHDRRNAN